MAGRVPNPCAIGPNSAPPLRPTGFHVRRGAAARRSRSLPRRPGGARPQSAMRGIAARLRQRRAAPRTPRGPECSGGPVSGPRKHPLRGPPDLRQADGACGRQTPTRRVEPLTTVVIDRGVVITSVLRCRRIGAAFRPPDAARFADRRPGPARRLRAAIPSRGRRSRVISSRRRSCPTLLSGLGLDFSFTSRSPATLARHSRPRKPDRTRPQARPPTASIGGSGA